MNKIIITGRITKDIELKSTQSGVPFCTFAVAVDRRYKAGEERKADFINCTAWRGTAEFISKYFGKGAGIALDGSLQIDSYTDKDGNKRIAPNVIVENAEFNGGKTNNEQGTTPPAETKLEELGDDEELPF